MARSAPKRAQAVTEADDPIYEIELPRGSGSHADVFAAVGLADLLNLGSDDLSVRIKNRGDTFCLKLGEARTAAALSSGSLTPGYQYLQPPSSKKGQRPLIPDGVYDILDYERERDAVNAVRKQEEAVYAAAKKARKPVDPEELEAIQQQVKWSREQWRRVTVYLTLQGHETANKVHATIAQLPVGALSELVRHGIRALADRRPTEVDWSVSTVQLFSPLAAKGYARLKPDSTGRGDKSKDAWADPFVEWLRYRGYFLAAVPVYHGKSSEHIRLLCPIPGEVSIENYRDIVAALRAPGAGASPPKIDILATLNLASMLITRSEDFPRSGVTRPFAGMKIERRAPSDIIAGLAVTNYQSLGQARAVSAMTELALPGWFRIESQQDAQQWIDILNEHGAIVRGLEDNHSDEFALLQGYRRFLEQRGPAALNALLDFAGAYGNHIFRVRDTGRPARQFTTDLFRKVVIAMEPKYAPILEDDGFRAVAAAVRRATVAAMTLNAHNADHRDIRYGLLPDLRRARELPGNEPLLVAVAEFVDVYNAENARRQETKKRPWHARVSTDELLAFTRLVDEFNAGIVGALLCAYGTCTERREPSANEPDPANLGDETATGEASDEIDDEESTDEN